MLGKCEGSHTTIAQYFAISVLETVVDKNFAPANSA